MKNTYSEIKTGRRLVWAGISLGWVTAVTVAGINLASDGDSPLAAIALLLVVSLPSTLAYLSLDRRPSLLAAAAMSAALLGVVTLAGGLGVILLIAAVLWALSIRRRPATAPEPRRAAVLRPALAALTLLPLFAMVSHLDPICTVVDATGSVVERRDDPTADSGWRLPVGGSVAGSSISTEGSTETCSSNVVEHWEAGLSALLSLGVAGLALRWPTNDALIDKSGMSAESRT